MLAVAGLLLQVYLAHVDFARPNRSPHAKHKLTLKCYKSPPPHTFKKTNKAKEWHHTAVIIHTSP